MATFNDIAVRQTLQADITAQQVAEADRMDFLPRHAGHRFLLVETTVYRMLEQLSTDYQGGYWDFYTLSNGGYFMAPTDPAQLRLCCDGNGYSGIVSAEAAGIIACSMALNRLSFQFEGDGLAEAFYQLRDFALAHPESAAIFGALD